METWEGRIPPWRIYSEEDSERIDYVEDAYKIAENFVKAWHAS